MDSKYAKPRNEIARCVLPLVLSLARLPASILIVEDDAFVRVLGVGMLADAGFRVIEAVDSDKALELLTADSDVQFSSPT
jgi:PleD family two-component response regulator